MKPWHTWTAFALCLALLAVGLGWLTVSVLGLDDEARRMRDSALIEENIRLSLWRMDSALATLIGRENSQPYFAYLPFYHVGNGESLAGYAGDIDRVIASPLLTAPAPQVRIHFQLAEDDDLTSPEVPPPDLVEQAVAAGASRERLVEATRRLSELASLVTWSALNQQLDDAGASTTIRIQEPAAPPDPRLAGVAQQAYKNTLEQAARTNIWNEQQSAPVYEWAPDAAQTPMQPIWVGTELVLVRRVNIAGRSYMQGCWLDWTTLGASLVASVRDLIPVANLVPIAGRPGGEEDSRRLAALPVRLVAGPILADPPSELSPARLALVAAWLAAILAAGAVAALLWGAVGLSERRAAFVSAVTHELRTPLTTFRMYTEMLESGMVKGPEQRARYLSTLRAEADRLVHLVENVLAYARLERGRAGGPVEEIPVGRLLGELGERLGARAREAEMTLAIELHGGVGSQLVRVDASAVERILFNLVDNSCKYARGGREPVIHLEAEEQSGKARIRIRDHGPGVSRMGARRLFAPFSKSAEQAAGAPPGVGLGLALSRRLARRLGGDIQLEESAAGASFVLALPIAEPSAPSAE